MMQAEIIHIHQVRRSTLPNSTFQTFMKGFRKCMRKIRELNYCNRREGRTALENWYACGEVSRQEYRLLMEYFDYGRGE